MRELEINYLGGISGDFNNFYALGVNKDGSTVKIPLKFLTKLCEIKNINIEFRCLGDYMNICSNVPLDMEKKLVFQRNIIARSKRNCGRVKCNKSKLITSKGWRVYNANTDNNIANKKFIFVEAKLSNPRIDKNASYVRYFYNLEAIFSDPLNPDNVIKTNSLTTFFKYFFNYNADEKYNLLKIPNGKRSVTLLKPDPIPGFEYKTVKRRFLWGFNYNGITIPFHAVVSLDSYGFVHVTGKPWK